MRDVLKRVESNGKHLLGLINDVLDLPRSRPASSRSRSPTIRSRTWSTTSTARSSRWRRRRSSRFKVEVPPDLPAGRGDERRLTQVLLNLVGNAIKFTDAGRGGDQGVRRQRLVQVCRCATPARASPQADQAKLFQEFQQADNSITKAKGGTGLGLAISKRIIEMHGGRIWVEFERRARLDLLIHASDQGRTAGEAAMSKRILVVEDQEDNRQILRDLLTSADYEMIEAENGEEALAAVAKQRPDLILMDIQLPIMDGYEATRRIKADPALQCDPDHRRHVLCAERRRGARRATAGCDAYVTKPYSPRQLLAKIREYLP